jgi:colanic acid/amylovoran biosynthesis glycosyltransferase
MMAQGSKRLKIAFLVGRFPALSETFILDQICGLIDAGYEVDIFASARSAERKIQPLVESYGLLGRTRYYHVPASRFRRVWAGLGMLFKMIMARKLQIIRALNIRAFGRQAASLRLLYLLYPLLDRGPYDILHCHFGTVGLAGTQLKDLGVPGKLIVTFHGNDISKFIKTEGVDVYRRLFEKADLLMPVSEYWRQRLVALGADPARVQVHHMGIDPRRFAFRPRSHPGGEEVCLLTVGRLVEKKAIPFALQAVAMLTQRHPDWKIRYNIIGSGAQEADLRQQIDQSGLQGRAYLLGSRTRDEVYQYMLDSHIFLLPSITDTDGDQEGIPVVIMEAMATGMPILSSLHSGIPELVQDGRSGYLVPERDVAGLVDRLEQLITHPEAWAEMGQINRRLVEDGYNIHMLNQRLIETYQSLTEKAV